MLRCGPNFAWMCLDARQQNLRSRVNKTKPVVNCVPKVLSSPEPSLNTLEFHADTFVSRTISEYFHACIHADAAQFSAVATIDLKWPSSLASSSAGEPFSTTFPERKTTIRSLSSVV